MAKRKYLKLLTVLKEAKANCLFPFLVEGAEAAILPRCFSIFMLENQNKHGGHTVWRAWLFE
jgi:hypothetical protein